MFAESITAEGASPLAGARTWSVKITASFLRLGRTHFHADLFCFDDWMCRISLTQAVASRGAAEAILVERCRNWIARHEERPRRGDTDFQVLG
jgi:hypothetical protein